MEWPRGAMMGVGALDGRARVAAAILALYCAWLSGLFFFTGDSTAYRNVLYLLVGVPMFAQIVVHRRQLRGFVASAPLAWCLTLVALACASMLYQEAGPTPTDVYDALRIGFLLPLFLCCYYLVRFRLPTAPFWLLVTWIGAGVLSGAVLFGSWALGIGPAAGAARLDPELALAWSTNRAANLFAMPAIAGLVLALCARRRGLQMAGWAGVVVGLGVVFWTQSRSGMLASAGTVVLTLAACRRWKTLAFMGALLALLATMAAVGWMGARDLTEFRTIDYRLAIYQDAGSRILASPLLGEGWMSSARTLDGRWAHAHNIILHVWMQGGLVGLLVFGALLATTVRQGLWLLRCLPSTMAHAACLFALMTLAYYLLVNMAVARPPYSTPSTSWWLLWLPIAIIAAEWHCRGAQARSPSGGPAAYADSAPAGAHGLGRWVWER
jgi:O-antigen ligase